MLGQRRRRWANIKTSLFQRVVFAGKVGDAISAWYEFKIKCIRHSCDPLVSKPQYVKMYCKVIFTAPPLAKTEQLIHYFALSVFYFDQKGNCKRHCIWWSWQDMLVTSSPREWRLPIAIRIRDTPSESSNPPYVAVKLMCEVTKICWLACRFELISHLWNHPLALSGYKIQAYCQHHTLSYYAPLLPCATKRQYLLTLQGSKYCLLASEQHKCLETRFKPDKMTLKS